MPRMFSLLSLDTPAYSASTASLASTANEPSRAWTRKYTKRFAVALSPRPLLSRQLIVGKPTPRHTPKRLSEPILVLTLSLVGYSERSFTGAWVCVTRRLNRPLRRLMSNCGKRGRNRNSMLALNLRPKVVPHGPRLLLGLIVRISGRLVAGRPRSGPEPPGSSGLAHGPGGHHPGDPGPVAALQKREGLLALRLGAPARVLPEALLPGPVQPQGTSPGARVARLAAVPRRGTLRSFGRLPRDGHDPRPGHRAGEGFPQGALLRAGHLRQERLQDRMDLRLQGGPGGRSWGRHHRLRAGRGLLRREAHSRRPRGRRPSRSVSGRQRVYGGGVGAALAGGVRGSGGRNPVRRLPQGVAEGRSALGFRQAPDHRRGDLPTEGLLLRGAPSGEDVGRAAGAPDGQGRSVYLRPASQRFAGPTSSSLGGPVYLTHCTSLVLELPHGEVPRIYRLGTRVNKLLLVYSRAVDLRTRRAGRPPYLPLQARGLPPHTLHRIARLFARDLGES